MRIQGQVSHNATLAMLLAFASGLPCFAQDGNLVLHANPKQAYVYVDDHAVGEASRHHSLKLIPGDHKVELVNYGYAPITRTVTITGGKVTHLEIALQAVASGVSPPFGAMTIEGANRDA